MGTEIDLTVGGITVDWSKNSIGNNHGPLFHEKDRKRISNPSYEYMGEERQTSYEMSFIKPLKEVVPRLELLGFTLEKVQQEYEHLARVNGDDWEEIADDDTQSLNLMSYAEFEQFIKSYPLGSLDNTFVNYGNADKETRIRGRFPEALTQRIPHHWSSDTSAYSERSFFGDLIGFLHPYSILRLLAVNPENLDAEVIWQYGPLVENGWASVESFQPGLYRSQTFLIATEGSSDVYIIKHALKLLREEIADFFKFIDVSESHPFSGTGNLVRFAEGLVKIDVHNNIVFLLDNDAEGFEAYQKISALRMPSNMRTTRLPDLEEFNLFPTKGPEGTTQANINGRAAGIECYLDLRLKNYPHPQVIWTNYKRDFDRYHGALEFKESYIKAFLKQTPEEVANGTYDVKKIEAVIEALIASATDIATNTNLGSVM